MDRTFGDKTIELVRGDITTMATDAIVNAANEHLAHGGGVAGAIAQAGGAQIQAESDAWVKKFGLVKTGNVAVTGGGRLKAKYVIHAVGPVMGSGDEDAKLASATENALVKAEELHLHSIAFPAVSTGIFGYPVERCAKIMLHTVHQHVKSGAVEKVVFCLWDEHSCSVFENELNVLQEQ